MGVETRVVLGVNRLPVRERECALLPRQGIFRGQAGFGQDGVPIEMNGQGESTVKNGETENDGRQGDSLGRCPGATGTMESDRMKNCQGQAGKDGEDSPYTPPNQAARQGSSREVGTRKSLHDRSAVWRVCCMHAVVRGGPTEETLTVTVRETNVCDCVAKIVEIAMSSL